MVPSTLIVWLLQLTMLQGAASSTADCGQPLYSPRIGGGWPASDVSWPWQVSILWYHHPVCGGSLIAEQWVLTAAHCFSVVRSISRYDVLLGAHQLSSLSSNAVLSAVERIILHPDYNGAVGSSGDIALVKLISPVKFTNYILPICLPESSEQFSMQANCWVTGWGSIRRGVPLPPPRTLQQLRVQLISREVCNTLFNMAPARGMSRDPVKQDMICAGYPGGRKGPCKGDSGGALVCQLKGGWTQAGVVSWGIGCAETYHPGVYASVPFYAKWIQDRMHGRNRVGGQNEGLHNVHVVTFTLMCLVLALL